MTNNADNNNNKKKNPRHQEDEHRYNKGKEQERLEAITVEEPNSCNCPCQHCHHKEPRIVIGTKEQFCELVADNLRSIVRWHRWIYDYGEGKVLTNETLNEYIIENRMENIKSCFYEFRMNQEAEKWYFDQYALCHIQLQHDIETFCETNRTTIRNPFRDTTFSDAADYIRIVWEIINTVCPELNIDFENDILDG